MATRRFKTTIERPSYDDGPIKKCTIETGYQTAVDMTWITVTKEGEDPFEFCMTEEDLNALACLINRNYVMREAIEEMNLEKQDTSPYDIYESTEMDEDHWYLDIKKGEKDD